MTHPHRYVADSLLCASASRAALRVAQFGGLSFRLVFLFSQNSVEYAFSHWVPLNRLRTTFVQGSAASRRIRLPSDYGA
jgi:hypothetical protein